jgi:high-affinity Fe2+/Pb2+ permease
MQWLTNLTNRIYKLANFLWSTFLLLTVIVLLSYAVWELNEVTEMLEMININSIEMPKIIEEIRG